MAYVLKSEGGIIIATSPNEKLGDDWELIADDDHQYLSFLEQELIKNAAFRESDIQLARVLEDLINVLIERNLIQFTDFPTAAQKRLNDRQSMRNKNRLTILLDDDNQYFSINRED
ncbi:MAG: hypothetical protein ACO1N8_08200 [Methylophilus sp.]